MSDIEKMKELKQRYFELVEAHGEEFTELKDFQNSLRELNKQHRLNAIKMYEDMISKVNNKTKSKS